MGWHTPWQLSLQAVVLRTAAAQGQCKEWPCVCGEAHWVQLSASCPAASLLLLRLYTEHSPLPHCMFLPHSHWVVRSMGEMLHTCQSSPMDMTWYVRWLVTTTLTHAHCLSPLTQFPTHTHPHTRTTHTTHTHHHAGVQKDRSNSF